MNRSTKLFENRWTGLPSTFDNHSPCLPQNRDQINQLNYYQITLFHKSITVDIPWADRFKANHNKVCTKNHAGNEGDGFVGLNFIANSAPHYSTWEGKIHSWLLHILLPFSKIDKHKKFIVLYDVNALKRHLHQSNTVYSLSHFNQIKEDYKSHITHSEMFYFRARMKGVVKMCA